jgi:endonuclease/exonuclease/phosphatase (EEP) superfamily protein YafD
MIIETGAKLMPVVQPRAEARTRPILDWLCATYLGLMVALWLVMRLGGDRWWPGTLLLLAPRWPYAAPLAALCPWAIARRRWWGLGTAGLGAAFLLVFVLGFHFRLPRGAAKHGDVRLLTCNIHRQHLDAPRLAAFIDEVRPDVVTLQGWSEMHRDALFQGGDWDVRHEGEILIASRFPIASVTPITLANDPDAPPGEQGAAMEVEVRTPRGPVRLLGLHLASPHAGLNEMLTDGGHKLAANISRRWQESRQLRELADRTETPLLLAGDFNSVGESPIFREDWGGFADAFDRCGSGLGYTYVVGHTQIRIDHILTDASWSVASCWVGPDVSAAHRPLVADLNFR